MILGIALCAVGIAGTLVPIIPGVPIILAGCAPEWEPIIRWCAASRIVWHRWRGGEDIVSCLKQMITKEMLVGTRTNPNSAESESILTVCLLAAFADGGKSETERAAIKAIAANLPGNPRPIMPHSIRGSRTRPGVGRRRRRSRSSAWNFASWPMKWRSASAMPTIYSRRWKKVFSINCAKCCGSIPNSATRIEKDTEAVAFSDFSGAEPTNHTAQVNPAVAAVADANKRNEIDDMILNYSILNGALELMPQSLSTLAIIPLQMKLVYRIGEDIWLRTRSRPRQRTAWPPPASASARRSSKDRRQVVWRAVRVNVGGRIWQVIRQPGDELGDLLRRHLRHRPYGAKAIMPEAAPFPASRCASYLTS